MSRVPPLETADLIDLLNDQRITTFNAQMQVREDAAAEIKRLRNELESWELRWGSLKWCHSGCGEDRRQSGDGASFGGSIGGGCLGGGLF